jgi:hypothetical protein
MFHSSPNKYFTRQLLYQVLSKVVSGTKNLVCNKKRLATTTNLWYITDLQGVLGSQKLLSKFRVYLIDEQTYEIVS